MFAALGLGFGLGEFGFFGVHAGADQDGAYRQMNVYQQVLKRIQTDYVVEPNMNDVTTGALHGLLESLDADSSYLTPTEYKIFKDRPATGVAQVGLTVSKRFGYATVVNVLAGSPADKEHVNDGDVIESIGDQSTRELSLAVIRMLLDGKPGTTVTISLVRPRKADPDKLTLTRAIVPVPAMSEQQYESASILYLKPVVINKARVDELAAKIKANKSRKILLDLRDVSGGDPDEGLRLANFFINAGTLGSLEGQKFPKQTFAADAGEAVAAADESPTVEVDLDVVPVMEIREYARMRGRVRVAEVLHGLIGEDHAPAEGVVGPIALVHLDARRRQGLAQQDGGIQTRGAAA